MTEVSAALVEREGELEVLGRLLGSARESAGGVVVVAGPARICESSLLAAVRALAGDVRVVAARGGELERGFRSVWCGSCGRQAGA